MVEVNRRGRMEKEDLPCCEISKSDSYQTSIAHCWFEGVYQQRLKACQVDPIEVALGNISRAKIMKLRLRVALSRVPRKGAWAAERRRRLGAGRRVQVLGLWSWMAWCTKSHSANRKTAAHFPPESKRGVSQWGAELETGGCWD